MHRNIIVTRTTASIVAGPCDRNLNVDFPVPTLLLDTGALPLDLCDIISKNGIRFNLA